MPNHATNDVAVISHISTALPAVFDTSPFEQPSKQKILWIAAPRGSFEKLGSTRLNSAQLNSTRIKSTQLNSTQLSSTQLNSTQLNSAQLSSAQLSSTQLTWLSPAAFPNNHSCCAAPGWLLWLVTAGLWWS